MTKTQHLIWPNGHNDNGKIKENCGFFCQVERTKRLANKID